MRVIPPVPYTNSLVLFNAARNWLREKGVAGSSCGGGLERDPREIIPGASGFGGPVGILTERRDIPREARSRTSLAPEAPLKRLLAPSSLPLERKRDWDALTRRNNVS
ncbi:hypothetical protein MRX96_052513 [Rhipicephalus microplus]